MRRRDLMKSTVGAAVSAGALPSLAASPDSWRLPAKRATRMIENSFVPMPDGLIRLRGVAVAP